MALTLKPDSAKVGWQAGIVFNRFARYEQACADWRRDGYPGIKGRGAWLKE